MSSNKTIAKNTLVLYFRMFFNMAVSLYTSRVVLQVLGVEDFGIYNLVGGVVVLFSFLNGSMNAATQRFINFEKATGVIENIKKIFNISVVNHLLISAVVLVLAETIGLWLLNNTLNIPSERISAANWVYQMSVATTVIGIIRTPYNGIILAYERMSFYAYLGVLETLGKLGIVFSLAYFPTYDLLVLYAVLFLLVGLLVNLIFYLYCRINFREITTFKFYRDFSKTKELLNFSSWTLLGQGAVVASTHGIGLVFNVCLGVTVNAAMAISNQVNNSLYGFISNAQLAFQPQIVQTYAQSNIARHVNLVLKSSRLSFYLMAIIAFPFLLMTEWVFSIWLGDSIPANSIMFTRVAIIGLLISALSGPYWMSAHAVGNIRIYQICLSILTILSLPLAYVLLSSGTNLFYVLLSKIFVDISIFFFRLFYFKMTVDVSTSEMLTFILNVFPVFISVVVGTLFVLHLKLEDNILFLLSITFVLEFFLILLVLFQGINKGERGFIINMLRGKLVEK